MELPLQITFRDLPRSEALEADIRDKAGKLDQFYEKVMACRVVVERPHGHQYKGELFHIRIDLTVPRAEIVIDRQENEDAYVALRDAFDAATFDSRKAARDPGTGYRIPPELDLAAIKRRSRYQDVYLMMDDKTLQQLILPVHGKGLWSTMYGFLSLADDLTTVNGFAFYEHGETPGLGGEIDNPTWKSQWPGKRIYDDAGDTRIEVLKGTVDKTAANAVHQADGLAGATLTARGVSNLLKYWMDADGYKPFLEKLKKGDVRP